MRLTQEIRHILTVSLNLKKALILKTLKVGFQLEMGMRLKELSKETEKQLTTSTLKTEILLGFLEIWKTQEFQTLALALMLFFRKKITKAL